MAAAPAHFDSRNVNSLWGSVLAETLHRCGVREAVVSPGSRSTPLAFALARHPDIEAVAVLDERSAAFFALGLAKRRMQPVALVCTSGTAGANYFPAVIEAQEMGVPLLIITADRPPEMRACASGQTIDQQMLFGGHVNFFHELAVPEATEPLLRYLRQTVAHALQRTCLPNAGPVHLNAPFRDPLPPVDDGGAAKAATAKIDWRRFFSHLAPVAIEIGTLAAAGPFVAHAHGVIVAGPTRWGHFAGYAQLVALLARKLGWPVLADATTSLRSHAALVPHLVTTYDTVLRNATAAERLRPEIVLCLGDWPASKVLRAWIESSDAAIHMIGGPPDNSDALHGRTQHSPISLGQLAAGLAQTDEASGYERMWAGYERKARAAIDARLGGLEEHFEGKAVWLLAQHLPVETPIFVASSMPVRDAEYFWPANDRRAQVFFNRGANGIDGTLSTALGVAHDAGKPTVLLTGDLALLHDTNGFLLRPKLRGSLSIVLINNRGGGIFEHLPVAKFEPPFEEFFATPQEVDFAKLGAAYGAEHVLVRDWAHFTGLVSPLPATGIRVLEVRTDRKADAATRKTWFAEIAAGLG